MKTMSADELREYMKREHEKSYLLIDVRQPAEYEETHIAGSIILPLNEFEEQVEALPEKNLIFYCRSGIRSKAAALTADFFNEAGKDIYTLEGGVLGWNGITVRGMPAFTTFDLDNGLNETLLDAMNLEKGAFRFYDHVLKYFYSDSVVDENYLDKVTSKDGRDINEDRKSADKHKTVISQVLKQARDGELGHARLIYSHLKNHITDIENSQLFEDVYEKLKGDILEGGSTFDEIIEVIDSRTEDHAIDILETAISMEYRAFDLYRVISERTEDSSLKDAFYSLAQAEKAHMNILVNALEQSVLSKSQVL